MPITDYFSGQQQNSNSLEEMGFSCNLTRTQRFYGFGICFATGTLLSLFSLFMLANPTGFAVLYSFGNIVALMATGFLIGFAAQFKKMFDNTRIIASCVFLTTIIATLCIAFLMESGGAKLILILILCFTQYIALFWYSISYIPFARDAILGFFKSCF